MAVSIFDDKAVVPDQVMVSEALGDTYPLWDELGSCIQKDYPNITGEWKFYGKAAGWTFLLKSKKRTLIYMIPNKNHYRIRIVLGEKAAKCVDASALPDQIKQAVRNATPYVEGRSVDMDINRKEQLEAVEGLLKVKFEN